jgi:hypothetical protein
MCGLRAISRALFTAVKEVQDTSCRGPGGVPQLQLDPFLDLSPRIA